MDNNNVLAAAVIGGGLLYLANKLLGSGTETESKTYQTKFGPKKIMIVSDEKDCPKAIDLLKGECSSYKVLGFDAEYNNINGPRPTALIQFSTHTGHCVFFRLSKMKAIPPSLRSLLTNPEIIKVGVGSELDARKINNDYGVRMKSTFDLRFLAKQLGYDPRRLSYLSESILDVELDDTNLCWNWETNELDDEQVVYAVEDAVAGIEIFKKLCTELNSGRYARGTEHFRNLYKNNFDTIFNYDLFEWRCQ